MGQPAREEAAQPGHTLTISRSPNRPCGRTTRITQITESNVSNAIERLARATTRYVVFLQGDGERNPRGQRNFDLGDFGTQLTEQGFDNIFRVVGRDDQVS